MKTILFVNLAGYRDLPPRGALEACADGAQMQSVTSLEAALLVIAKLPSLDILASNASSPEIFAAAKDRFKMIRTILVTDLAMRSYSAELHGAEDKLIDHVVVNKTESDWTTHELRITIQKILRSDVFGIDKYLAAGTKVHQRTVTNSDDRDILNSEVMEFAKLFNVGQHTSKMIFGITEELLMNAIYDAPIAGGRTLYHALPRSRRVELQEDEYATLSYGCDGEIFAVSVSDPFGALKRKKLFEYLKKVLMKRDSSNLIDNKEGGAGLGLFKILYSSHALVCNVEPKVKTEIISVIDTRDHLRDFANMGRSIHYFSVGDDVNF